MVNNGQVEANENQFENISQIPLSRSPLDTIPDPSQFSKEFVNEILNQSGVSGSSVVNRRKFESAHSTPVRRTSYVGQLGACTGPRAVNGTGERRGSVSRVSRRISSENCDLVAAEVPCFELLEDPEFWDDHNVQVLIRMRPLNNMEKMAQGYSRCLKQESLQTLVWLGHPEVKFTFDHIVSETISQEKLFRVAGLPMIDNCMSGYNSCMFAYGQTGSGKTYTMMGEISQRDGKFVDDCGMTPRLFEYLFTRIKQEEENRKDERLKYSCKCSFLEIYNEQITDLLEPSSTNLQLREGLKEGVYVENLTEYNVETVDEVLKLLLQGAANRKVAGTDMNSESSRSHSVFTCIVESRWEKDSVTHLRFGRLNLVDLAGSERQRSSGAGERLKEASYINKSLSTLGLVIMSLVDVTHGKHRHVPYRDSRLTFLLQDSLGGNSKTTIIANVSPSMCAANETLSTLKFAQRAKLIQNNAKVNEDASGDVTALQRQIQMLKEQMLLLMKHQKIPKPLLQVEFCESEDSTGKNINDDSKVISDQKLKVETVSSSIDLEDKMKASNQVEDKILLDESDLERTDTLHTNLLEELMDARTLIDTMKSQQARLIEELEYVRQENDRLVETLTNNNKPQILPTLNHETHISGSILLDNQNADQSMMDLQSRLAKMTKDLEDLKLLNDPMKDQVDLVHEKAENEAINTILNLQDELASLQVKYHRRLCTMSEENKKLKGIIAAKEDEVYALHSDWERASLELTSFLLDGSKSLKDASGQIESIASSFPHNVSVAEHVKKAAMVCIEKEETILQLEKNLVDAQCTIQQMQEKLNSLRTATMALTEIQFNTEDDEKKKDEYQIIAELAAIKSKLDNMMDCLSSIHERSIFEDLEGSVTDSSTSSSNLSDDEDVLDNMLVQQTSSNQESEKAYLLLKNQLLMASEAFVKLDVQLATVFKDKDLKELQIPEMQAKTFDEDKDCKASSFFRKFEEAHATMSEVDNVLNALLKVNEEAKLSSGRWKQTAEEVMMEKASLIEEISQLKVDLQLRDEEHTILKVELENLVSMLEGSFQHLQKEADDLCQLIYSDALTIAHGTRHIISKSRSSLQDICAETMEKSFASVVVQQCRFGEYINKFGLHDEKQENYSALVSRKESGELGANDDDLISENLKLHKELERKTTLLNGLFFDFSLLQESASTRKDIKDEAEKLFTALSQVQHELRMKANQLDDMTLAYEKLESCLTDTEAALTSSKSCLQHSEETVEALSYQNAELRSLLEDLYLKTSETEKQLEEHKEMVKTLENEIHCTASSTQEHFLFSLEGITDDLKRVSVERDQLCEQVNSLQDRLEMAYAMADEKEAIAVEARQESQASKIYAEQKEEEVKILERSIEELDSTINMLEKRVNEMEDQLERHHRIRDSLEVELQSLSQRLLTFESFRNGNDSNNTIVGQPEDQISRKLHSRYLELQEAHARIKDLEDERTEQANEIKQQKDYISELVIHAEAQASQYQQKYKSLEAMVRMMQTDSSKSVSEAPLTDKTEKSSVRARGSSSPFRCIGNLVQQMNTEKDQELSLAKLQLEELETVASNRQKEICMLNTRLAAAESMTHDVIRDLLGVKLDMTNYANLINQNHLQRFIEDAAQQTQEFIAMEQETRKLKRKINDLLEERDRCISELNSKEADILASKMTLMQLQGRDQLLTAQNEMLKADKTNLQRRVAELDDMIKKLLGTHPTASTSQQHENHMSKACSSNELGKRLANSEKLLLRVNNELVQYRKPDSSRLHHKMDEKRVR
ncbi:kinesin-like protein KIN-12C isoform X2 [Bidens hawaiensis]|uniref:kinesin-like protein KIN-12C isoform X2 n=1 Tax=Bidens hawaiensis TaxID=980011 RepID=UPI00404A2A6D